MDLLCQFALELGLTPAHYRKPLLRRTLSLQMHEPLRQRIAVQYQLDGARQRCASTASAFLSQMDRAGVSRPLVFRIVSLTNRLTGSSFVRNWPFRGRKNRLDLIGIADIEEHSVRKLTGHFSWFKIDHKQRLCESRIVQSGARNCEVIVGDRV